MKKTALISDFDGTISKEDFFNMAIERLLTPDDLQPWQDYLDKKITHYQALDGIFSKIHISQKALDAFIDSIEIDDKFPDALKLCKKFMIPVYICSAGMDYYIFKKIAHYIKEYNITVISNAGKYSRELGFKLSPPDKNDIFYDKNTGISKEAVVKYLKELGFFTVYAGDGIPDIKAAKIADAVFAKGALLDFCKKAGIKTFKFDGFADICRAVLSGVL
ncbi:MAG: MtnX-like HAD-IB family phosphatase [Endomicrobium sp.]|jgi:2,3-diketo-5-methylthio-1-phosphopentane phosphatase|nr:MtnX-like HAD-IB family phosphatase [Endomicrobium sp.]